MSKVAILLLLLFSLFFSSCAKKELIVKKELVCNKQLLVPRASASFRIYKDDLELAKSFKEMSDSAYNFYEQQVKQNNKLCKKKEKK